MISYAPLFKTMKEKNITSYRLEKLGFSRATYYSIQKGNSISTNTVNQLCKLLKCNVWDIMEFIEDDEEWAIMVLLVLSLFCHENAESQFFVKFFKHKSHCFKYGDWIFDRFEWFVSLFYSNPVTSIKKNGRHPCGCCPFFCAQNL